ncbi:hypothetical protein [Desulfovibrio cuneatus]|uniref:hypothetical protein n=1 Tax=Desulfovibrio cuneatus TaxID=159728 RepID=UPI00040A0DF2|nr:hypothetical protein [Desulfovibrio cuneatus]
MTHSSEDPVAPGEANSSETSPLTFEPELEALFATARSALHGLWASEQPEKGSTFAFGPYENGAHEADQNAEAPASRRRRYAAYLEALHMVLQLPGGVGVRVLLHWLEAADGFALLCQPAPQVFAAAALADYARERLAEIAQANPEAYVRMQFAQARSLGRTLVP